MIGQVGNALGAWGKPVDPVAWAALALAVLLAAAALERHHLGLSFWFHSGRDQQGRLVEHLGLSRRRFLVTGAFVAAFLSLGYVAFYLRGGPRIIDATSYFMQGRALSHGKLSWPLTGPTASFRGRFFLFHEPNRLAGIFPPGYPLLLAIGFLIGAPMLIGPLLAAGIAVATYFLTRELALTIVHHDEALDMEATSRFAALLSIVCAALRYHTADTMSHGACALAFVLALTIALRAIRHRKIWLIALCGLAVGYVAATRMVSTFPVAIGVMLIVWPAKAWRVRGLGLFAVGMVPGLALLLVAQWAATGNPLQSTQLAYYAVSDGPAGCFRYGFGHGIGCLVEHTDFVHARLADGYGLLEAFGTTLRRLWLHMGDVLNFEPLFLLLLLPIARATKTSRVCRAIATVVLLQILAYAPFYFDGNYPGGGARFFADVLPLEHALIAVGLALFFSKAHFQRAALATLAACALGFAVHAGYGHHALAERDGGQPMYQPDLVREANFTDGLLFFDTDHGFNLAYDPAVTPSHGILAVRRRNDDGDRLLYDLLGHPISHHFRFAPKGEGVTLVESWTPSPIVDGTYRFEAEVEWPPIAQAGGYAQAIYASEVGASQERILQLTPQGSATPEDTMHEAWAEIELPMPHRDGWTGADIQPRVVLRGTGARGSLILYDSRERKERLRWEWSDDLDSTGKTKKTMDLPAQALTFGDGEAPMSYRLVLRAQQGAVGLDKTTVKAHR